jgi:serine/threonine protein kinase/class 3 adenylate cyclase
MDTALATPSNSDFQRDCVRRRDPVTKGLSMPAAESDPTPTMVARISLDDVIIYANEAFAAYLGTPKRNLVGSSLPEVAALCTGEVSSCFARPETGRTSNRLVSDGEGRIFEAQMHSDGGMLDVVLDEIRAPGSLASRPERARETSEKPLTEDELRVVRHPERRYLTVTYTRLQGLAHFAERLAPMEVKLMVDSFVEEACEAVRQTGGTVGELGRDTVLGVYGAPRYYADHPLRAILAACDQIQRTAQLHAGLYREGKELPPCSCGIWTGDTLIGMPGPSAEQRDGAIGAPVDLAIRLCELALPGETVLPEHTLTHMLRTLPEGWQHLRAESEHEPDLSGIDWSRMDIIPVPEHLKKVVYLVGRGVQEDADRTELYFDYRWSFRPHGRDQSTPILRVVRPTLVGDSFELTEDNVVTTQPTQAFGRYKLIEVVGTGGMGTVWRGVDRFGNILAIKILQSGQNVTDAQLKRFRREAEIMAQLPHRNICRVYDMNEFDGIQYIAMEFVDGLPLSDLLYEGEGDPDGSAGGPERDLRALIQSVRSAGPAQESLANGQSLPRSRKTRILPFEQTLSLVMKVCDAVQFAHEHGVLHRDLKPGNILLRADGEPLVADFGLAKLKSGEGSGSLSLTGHVVGTFENMAPEQAESSKDVDERADVYSIGTILYQMLCGRRHFDATGNIVKDAQALKTHEPSRLRAFHPQIHPDLEIITLKALRNDPAERYRSIAALRADIDHYRRGEVISARPVSPLDLLKKLILRNKLVAAVIAVSILTVAGGAILSIYFLNAKLREANAEYLVVGQQLGVANRREQEAKLEADIARAERARAEDSLAKIQLALDAPKSTPEQITGRPVEGEAEGRSHEDAEPPEDLEPTAAAQPVVPAVAWTDHEPESRSDPVNTEHDVHSGLLQASHLVNDGLSPDALRRLDKRPEEVVRRLVEAMDNVCRALTDQLDSRAAWMLKGRLHLALMEFEQAIASFKEAERSDDGGEDSMGVDSPRETLDLAVDLSRSAPAKFERAAERLRASPKLQDQAVGRILQFLNGKPGLGERFSNAPGPLRRRTTPNEAALGVIQRNGSGTRVFVEPSDAGRDHLTIWNASDLSDLSPLLDAELSGLAVVGAKTIDWQTILTLPVDSLDFARCAITSLPQTRRGFLRLRSLKLSRSAVANLDFVWGMPLLETLDLSFTQIADLSPLLVCRSLRHLDLAGLDPANWQTLLKLPLESLTISPGLITDKKNLNLLRAHRTLKILRSPDDPSDQSAVAFWRKLDEGISVQAR